MKKSHDASGDLKGPCVRRILIIGVEEKMCIRLASEL